MTTVKPSGTGTPFRCQGKGAKKFFELVSPVVLTPTRDRDHNRDMSKDQNPANIRFVMKKVNDVANRYGNNVDTMALFDMAVSLLSEIPNLPEPGEGTAAPEVVAIHDHDALARKALTTPAVMEHVRNGNTVYAIKALREVTLCTLKEGKDAIEDYGVQGNKGETDSWLARNLTS